MSKAASRAAESPPRTGSPAAGLRRPSAMAWAPALVLAAGLAAGILLWAKWGLAVAFEAIRAYCL